MGYGGWVSHPWTRLLGLAALITFPCSAWAANGIQDRLLPVFATPNRCVILLSVGVLLVYLEIHRPGMVVPGALGLLLVLLALHALYRMPYSATGLLLCLVAGPLIVLEAYWRARGLLAAGGILALIAGLRFLVKGAASQMQVDWGVATGVGLLLGGSTAVLAVLGARARRIKLARWYGAGSWIGPAKITFPASRRERVK